jgi:hypothetical protein
MPIRVSLAVTKKGSRTIKVWRLYGFGFGPIEVVGGTFPMPIRVSLAVTKKGSRTIKVWRLYGFGFGPKSAPIKPVKSIRPINDFRTPRNFWRRSVYIYIGRRGVFGLKPYPSGHFPPSSPSTASPLRR